MHQERTQFEQLAKSGASIKDDELLENLKMTKTKVDKKTPSVNQKEKMERF